MNHFTTNSVVKALKQIGIKPIKVSEADDQSDGEVSISETRHIQVGTSYLMVVDENGDEFTFSQELYSLAQLKRELQKAVAA